MVLAIFREQYRIDTQSLLKSYANSDITDEL